MNPTPLELGAPRFTGGDSSWSALLARLPVAQALASVEGSFAFALPLPDGRVVLAVDRFAQETLCYRVVDGQLRVAERADQLGSTAVDPQALFDYLYFHDIPSPRTVFGDVHRLPPGHYAVFQDGRLEVARFWTPTFTPEASPSYDALREEFLQLVEQAVASRLGSGPAACFLSGGTDSSTVAGMASRITGGKAVTYSIGFEAQGYDEMAFARIAARHFGTDHREYYVTPDDLVRSIAHVAASYDQPFGNSSALPAYYCALKAKEDGVQRMLAGDGGDELFGGNSRYAMQRVFGWYDGVPRFLRAGALEPFFGLPAVARTPLLKKGSSYIRQAEVPLPDRLQMYNLLQRLGLSEVLTPGFLAHVDAGDVLRQQREVWSAARASSDLDRMLAFDWRYTLAESDLPKVRGTTRLAGVEVAFPLLDDGLLAFSARLPADYKLRRLKLRWFFKQALRGFLPDEILTKKKQGFGLPFGVWATRHAGLHQLASASLAGIAERGIVRRDFLKTLIEVHLPAHPGYYGEMVWILMMMEQWLQAHAPGFKIDP